MRIKAKLIISEMLINLLAEDKEQKEENEMEKQKFI